MMDRLMERTATKKPRAKRMRLSSVANSIRLTKAFSENEFEMGISALAARLGLAKSTVHRLATTLVEYDILEQNRETGKYRLGIALFELGTLVRRKMDAASGAQVQIHALAEASNETVQLAILDHLSVLYIRVRESRQAVRMSTGREPVARPVPALARSQSSRIARASGSALLPLKATTCPA